MCQVSDSDVRVLLERTAHLVGSANKLEKRLESMESAMRSDHDSVTRLDTIVSGLVEKVAPLIEKLDAKADKTEVIELCKNLTDSVPKKVSDLVALMTGAGTSGAIVAVVWVIAKVAGWL